MRTHQEQQDDARHYRFLERAMTALRDLEYFTKNSLLHGHGLTARGIDITPEVGAIKAKLQAALDRIDDECAAEIAAEDAAEDAAAGGQFGMGA